MPPSCSRAQEGDSRSAGLTWCGCHPRSAAWSCPSADPTIAASMVRTMPDEIRTDQITVFLADDNLLVREGVRALVNREDDLEVVGVAADYDELVAGAVAAAPQVVVTDIRMPPSFQREGIEAAKEVRRHHPGTGI